MHAAELTHAVQRLRHAPWPSPVTHEALRWLAGSPSKAGLIAALACSRSAPVALEICLCDGESSASRCSRPFARTIEHNAALCWALVESLNRLPWYGGIRAFLSLEEPPESSPCVYPFYILARNKLFIPTDMPPELYAYCYRGLWRLLPVARSENWQSPHHSVLAVVGLMDRHLRMPRPDPFVVYLSGSAPGADQPDEIESRCPCESCPWRWGPGREDCRPPDPAADSHAASRRRSAASPPPAFPCPSDRALPGVSATSVCRCASERRRKSGKTLTPNDTRASYTRTYTGCTVSLRHVRQDLVRSFASECRD